MSDAKFWDKTRIKCERLLVSAAVKLLVHMRCNCCKLPIENDDSGRFVFIGTPEAVRKMAE